MASVGGISLDRFATGDSVCAVALRVQKSASTSRVFHFSDWEVELAIGSTSIVARTVLDLSLDQLIEGAVSAANEALDLAAVVNFDRLALQRPLDEFVVLQSKGRSRLTLQLLVEFPMAVQVGITLTRGDGTSETASPAYPSWSPAFRFYRLSQVSSELFDAYRNLFLALEALLDQLFPKRSSEGEKQWLLRAFKEIAQQIDLSVFDPRSSPDPAVALVDWLYGVRPRLFHAKQGRTYVPDVRVGYAAVSEAYVSLVQIWRRITEVFLHASAPGGVVTNSGFRLMGQSIFRETRIGITSDATPVGVSEDHFSPKGEPLVTFDSFVDVAQDRPGRVRASSVLDLTQFEPMQIGRVGLISNDNQPMIVSDDAGIINTDGVADLEVRLIAKLVNTQTPRMEF
jgi:hypothetical protein